MLAVSTTGTARRQVAADATASTSRTAPSARPKEVIGGFVIYELPSKAEAVQLTREFHQMRDLAGMPVLRAG
jgi:hypothetical protein